MIAGCKPHHCALRKSSLESRLHNRVSLGADNHHLEDSNANPAYDSLCTFDRVYASWGFVCQYLLVNTDDNSFLNCLSV